MLKRASYIFIISMVALMCGCSHDLDNGLGDADAGFIAPHVYVDGDDAPDVGAFSLTLSDGRGKEHTWDKLAAFSSKQGFRPGRYVMSASYGSENAEGFGKPFYTGSASFDVVPNETADVALHCKRVNVCLLYTSPSPRD